MRSMEQWVIWCQGEAHQVGLQLRAADGNAHRAFLCSECARVYAAKCVQADREKVIEFAKDWGTYEDDRPYGIAPIRDLPVETP